MATECYSQLGFGFRPKLVVDFAGGTLTTDAACCWFANSMSNSGSVRMWSAGSSTPVTRATSRTTRRTGPPAAVSDRRRVRGRQRRRPAPARPHLSGGRSQRTHHARVAADALAAGECDRLVRIHRLARTGVNWFCAHAYGPDEHPADLILDLESTDDPTHGTQQLALFHGWYRPAHVSPARVVRRPHRTAAADAAAAGSGCQCDRRGGRTPAHPAASAPPVSPHADLFCAGTRGWPHRPSRPNGGRRHLLRAGNRHQSRLQGACGPARRQGAGPLRAARTSGAHSHELLASREVVAPSSADARQDRRHRGGLNIRFMVTNRRGRADDLIAWYNNRGTSENWIKELKLDVHADRLSCHRFRANAFRLQLHSLALLLLAYFRRAVLAGTRLGSATVDAIRLQLLKVAGRFVRSVRPLWFHLASLGPATRSSPAVIGRSPARPCSHAPRDSFFDGTAAAAGGVVTWALGGAFGDSRLSRRGRTPSLYPF